MQCLILKEFFLHFLQFQDTNKFTFPNEIDLSPYVENVSDIKNTNLPNQH